MIDLIQQLMHDESATFQWTSNERNFQQSIIIWIIALNTLEFQKSAIAYCYRINRTNLDHMMDNPWGPSAQQRAWDQQAARWH